MSKYNNYLSFIESQLPLLIPNPKNGQKIVTDAMAYSLENGGKRIRPVLAIEFCNVCGGKAEDAIEFACAVEMLHTYSLIHDDLPCMDNDNMRRGKPSNHIAFGEANALLAGDALLTHAFEAITKASNVMPENIVKAVNTLSSLSGVNGMIGGQVLDLENESKTIDYETLVNTHKLKTGALIKCACILGCLAANADENMTNAATIYAENVGLAFQIIDDILDVIGNEQTLGKPIGSDAQNEKTTYVSLLGLEKSKQTAKELTDEAVDALSIFNSDTSFLKEIAINLLNRNN